MPASVDAHIERDAKAGKLTTGLAAKALAELRTMLAGLEN